MAVVGFVWAVAVSLAVCGLAYRFGGRLGLLDRPDDDLKTHERPVVPLGGLGLLVGVHTGLAAAGAFDLALLAATVVVWVLGLIDDIRGLSPAVRLIGAVAAGVVLVGFTGVAGGAGAFVFWVLATVVVVNAINLLDGMDGLVGVVSIVALGGIWWFGVIQDLGGPELYLAAIGGVLGFIYWNLPPAKMFLGDNGAYVVALVLTWAALRASPDGSAGLVAAAIIGVPLLDLGLTVSRRLATGRPLFKGDRDHTYDRLRAAGRSVAVVLVMFAAFQAVWAAGVIGVAHALGDRLAAVVVALVGGLIVGAEGFRSRRSGRA